MRATTARTRDPGMGLEEDLGRLLGQSVEDVMPPVGDLVAEGMRLGRRRRRLRRGLQAAGAALAVAGAVAAGSLVVPGFVGSEPVQAASAAVGPTGVGPSPAQQSPSQQSQSQSQSQSPAQPEVSPAPTGPLVDMTWQAMLKIFADQLPPGGRLLNLDPFAVKFNNVGMSRHYIELQYDDGAGPATVMVTLGRSVRMSSGGFSCATWTGSSDEGPRRAGSEKPMCRETTLPDGAVMTSYITGTDAVGLYDQGVKVERSNGDFVQIVAANATLDQYTGQSGQPITVTRDRPPLGLSGWEAIARSALWQQQVPLSTAVAGVEFAKSVGRFPCPDDAKAADCVID
ncbi:hypothetical protein ACGFX4_18385 [Kitasatospora sp. NPDC048365]|uniref:hypothetical protein n=1 Tax=Kitasatospora sp. NPDC048365 TaxID=3364050 RepID=UPI00372077B0